jgi:hypothetical protein
MGGMGLCLTKTTYTVVHKIKLSSDIEYSNVTNIEIPVGKFLQHSTSSNVRVYKKVSMVNDFDNTLPRNVQGYCYESDLSSNNEVTTNYTFPKRNMLVLTILHMSLIELLRTTL